MYYNINKLLNGAKKYNIKIAERGFGQTYYLRQKIEEMKKQIDLDNECEIALNSKVMDLEKEIEELKEEKAKRQWVHIKENGEVEPLFYVSEDKIKAKIEEIDKVLKGQLIEKIRVYFEAQKEVLQSLLEKEGE